MMPQEMQQDNPQIQPDQLRSALGFATMLQEQHMQSQMPQNPAVDPQNAQGQESQSKEEIGAIVQNAVKEAISGLRNDIKKVLEEDDNEDDEEE